MVLHAILLPRTIMARFVCLMAGVTIALAAALSAAQTPAASATPTQPSSGETQPVPIGDVDIALVLPLDVPAFSRAADAVRSGFLAAAGVADSPLRIQLFAHGTDGVLAAIEAARLSGAKVIVGPLARDDVNAVAQLATELPTTIALNQLEDGVAAPPYLHAFALAADSDARLVARRMRADGIRNAAIVDAESSVSKRMGVAFTAQWLAGGGAVPNVFRFDAAPETLTKLRRDFLRHAPDAVLVALDGADVTLAKAYLGTVPAYASGLLFEQMAPATSRDLDGLTVVEIPWLVTPDARQFASLPRSDYPSAALTRLYAFGLDAFRIARAFRDGPPAGYTLDGATGRITLVDGQRFSREGRLVIYRNGEPVPVDAER